MEFKLAVLHYMLDIIPEDMFSGLLKDGSYCLLLDIAKSQWVHGVELLGSFNNAVQPPVESKRGDFYKEKRAKHVHMYFMEDNLQYAIS